MFDAHIYKHCWKVLKCNIPLVIQNSTYCTSAVARPITKLKQLELSDRTRDKQPFEKYFVENLFLNKFQEKVLEYPQLGSLKEVNSLNSHCNNAKDLLVASTAQLLESGSDVTISNVKKLELTGIKMPIKQGGFGYQNSEYIYMQESFGSDQPLAKTISENEELGLNLINSLGNERQKEKYISKLVSGEYISCFAHTEPDSFASLDPDCVNTKAVPTEDGKGYYISGTKIGVLNASYANVMVFSANTWDNAKEKTEKDMTLFLIDKNADGVTISEPEEVAKTKGVDVCTVTFTNVYVPKTCILGEPNNGMHELRKVFTNYQLNHSVQCVSAMKTLLQTVIDHCVTNKYFRKNKYEVHYFNVEIGRLVAMLYASESMAYLVAGRLDSFEDPDLHLESLILKIFSTDCLEYMVKSCTSILGTEAYTENFNQIVEDSQLLITDKNSNNYLKLIVAASGLKFVNAYREKHGLLHRFLNSLTHQRLNSSPLSKKDKHDYTPKNILRGYVHLMFERESKLLEDMVLRLELCTNKLLKQYGEQIFERHVELQLLADMVIAIYTGVSLLGRGSRAYCLGVRRQEVDKSIVYNELSRLHSQVIKSNEIINQNVTGNSLESIGDCTFKVKNYPFAIR